MSNNIKIDQKDLTRLRQKLNKLSLLDSKVLSNELGAAGLDLSLIHI